VTADRGVPLSYWRRQTAAPNLRQRLSSGTRPFGFHGRPSARWCRVTQHRSTPVLIRAPHQMKNDTLRNAKPPLCPGQRKRDVHPGRENVREAMQRQRGLMGEYLCILNTHPEYSSGASRARRIGCSTVQIRSEWSQGAQKRDKRAYRRARWARECKPRTREDVLVTQP